MDHDEVYEAVRLHNLRRLRRHLDSVASTLQDLQLLESGERHGDPSHYDSAVAVVADLIAGTDAALGEEPS